MFRKGFFGGEVFDQLDDLETLSRRELQERAEQAQTFDRAACRRAELEVQFSREIEVLHLAPMTESALRIRGWKPDQGPVVVTERHDDDELWVRAPQQAGALGCKSEQTRSEPRGCNYVKEQPIRQAKP